MRVIAGKRRGLKLLDFEGMNVRPTTDRVKENIFNIIFPYIDSAYVLDLFCGSGALSIEALSRGAEKAVLCDLSDKSLEIARKNLIKADFTEQARVIKTDAISYLRTADDKFDIIFLDPPYDTGLLEAALKVIAERGVLSENGIIVSEQSDTELVGEIDGLKELKSKKYGRTYIRIYALS